MFGEGAQGDAALPALVTFWIRQYPVCGLRRCVGSENGQFSTPYGIADGVVYVTDIGNDRIQTFTLDQ